MLYTYVGHLKMILPELPEKKGPRKTFVVGLEYNKRCIVDIPFNITDCTVRCFASSWAAVFDAAVPLFPGFNLCNRVLIKLCDECRPTSNIM